MPARAGLVLGWGEWEPGTVQLASPIGQQQAKATIQYVPINIKDICDPESRQTVPLSKQKKRTRQYLVNVLGCRCLGCQATCTYCCFTCPHQHGCRSLTKLSAISTASGYCPLYLLGAVEPGGGNGDACPYSHYACMSAERQLQLTLRYSTCVFFVTWAGGKG
jgi:hypothetical protein